jgi:hypothetical protein
VAADEKVEAAAADLLADTHVERVREETGAAPASDWWITDRRTHYAGDGYTSSTLELWDAERRPLARAHQTMYVRMDVPELRG